MVEMVLAVGEEKVVAVADKLEIAENGGYYAGDIK